ncbi:hypothetical protein LCGC14_1039420 [marine sediment metagenome]|uniref:Uncharacterized protein n=1 Tax=marine sediment metagenome TaxID=412755 RepID=A0A0F9MWN5_9ZZZZ
MAEMTEKEIQIQFALGTLSPMKLFLKMLSMQNEDTIKSDDWDDDRNPSITTKDNGDTHVEISDCVVFVFNSKEEYVGMFNYKD